MQDSILREAAPTGNRPFHDHAPTYAEAGLVVFPCDDTKRPMVRNHLRFTPDTQATLRARFPTANVGIVLDPRRGTGLTVVDIDTHTPSDTDAATAECVRLFGDTPIKIATPSGGRHLWYRRSGEGRRIRPLPGLPVDVLSGGVAIAPPSEKGAGMRYAFEQGGIADVRSLPEIAADRAAELFRPRARPQVRELHRISPEETLAALDRSTGARLPVAWEAMGEGDGRNAALFHWAKDRVGEAPSREAFRATLHQRNACCGVPLPPSEVERIAANVWRYRERGTIMRAGAQSVVLPTALLDIAKASPDAWALLSLLKAAHGHKGRAPFPLARAMAGSLGWSLPRWKAARAVLFAARALVLIHAGGNGPHDPPLAQFGDGS